MAATQKMFKFAVELPWYKQASVIVLSETVQDARHDASAAAQVEAGGMIGRVRTTADEARRVRNVPADAVPVRGCYTVNDYGEKMHWAWLIVEKL